MKELLESNYWEINSEFKIIESFKKLYTEDTSKNKTVSSKIMWGVHLTTHPESKFYNLPDKFEVIAKDWLGDAEFNWEKIQDIIDTFKESVLSDAERALVNWNETMRLRDSTIKEMYQTALGNKAVKELVELDKMLANTPKMFADYTKVKKEFEEDKLKKKGKTIKSLSDTGEI